METYAQLLVPKVKYASELPMFTEKVVFEVSEIFGVLMDVNAVTVVPEMAAPLSGPGKETVLEVDPSVMVLEPVPAPMLNVVIWFWFAMLTVVPAAVISFTPDPVM